jgi:hypothetical protein
VRALVTRGDAALALDRSACTIWNSGAGAPQSITLDLGEPRPIGHVVLVAAMTPAGQVAHVVEVSDDGVTFDPRARYDGEMFDGGVFGLTLVPAARARFVRVRTERSPSWVAWRDVVPTTCQGETFLPPRAKGSSPRTPSDNPHWL